MRFQETMKTLECICKNAYEQSTQQSLVIMTKADNDLVTNIDKSVQDYLEVHLKALYPHIPFQGEESQDFNETLEEYWLVDPIDGTYNFVHLSPSYGISLALIRQNKPYLSAIYLPATNDFIYAQEGNGSYVNKRKVTLDSTYALETACITFGDFSSSNPLSRPHQAKCIALLCDVCKKIRINGASSVDFANLVKGYSQGHILYSRRPWELAPGMLIAKEAGFVTISATVDGLTQYLCLHPSISDEVLERLHIKSTDNFFE